MTGEPSEITRELAELDQHLAVHGPELARWPISSQQRFALLLMNNADAQRLLAEAQSIERLLHQDPEVPAERLDRLRAKLLAAVEAEQAAQRPVAALRPALRPVRSRTPQRTWGLPAGAALAASLGLGLLIGTFGIADRILRPADPAIQDLASSDVDGEDSELAFGADFSDLDEEDTL